MKPAVYKRVLKLMGNRFEITVVCADQGLAESKIKYSYQHGLLATKYQRDYFTDGSERVENLLSARYKLPIAARLKP